MGKPVSVNRQLIDALKHMKANPVSPDVLKALKGMRANVDLDALAGLREQMKFWPPEGLKSELSRRVLSGATTVADMEALIGYQPAADILPATAGPLPAPSATPISTSADLGRLVRQRRKALGFSQQQLADSAGVGRRFVSELENGKDTLEFGRLIAVCRAAGLDLFAKGR